MTYAAALKLRWGALQTARTNTTEEDLLHELLGVERTRRPRTELPWLRVDVTLRASTAWGQQIRLRPAPAWQRLSSKESNDLQDWRQIEITTSPLSAFAATQSGWIYKTGSALHAMARRIFRSATRRR